MSMLSGRDNPSSRAGASVETAKARVAGFVMSFNFGRVVAVLCATLIAGAVAAASVVVTEPSGVVTVRQGNDFATQVFQDPWDMHERTDLGWFLNSLDQPASNLTGTAFAEGYFSATTLSDDPVLFLLDSPIPGTAMLGKTGAAYPIDAERYSILAFRMQVGQASDAQVFWSTTDMYSDINGAGNIPVRPGWGVYMASIPALDRFLGAHPWSGEIRMLRLDPTAVAGDSIVLDWVRLVQDDPALRRTVVWSSGGPVDIFLDDDTDPANGNLGRVASGISGSSLEFFVGGLPAGDYWVAAAPAGMETMSYSPGFYRVSGVPRLRFLAPGEMGSADDFATVQLGDAWDMDRLEDVDHAVNITDLGLAVVLAEDEAGTTVELARVLQGTSASAEPGAVGDPILYTLWPASRGKHYRIDPERYRILTLEMGLPGARDIVNGSVARVVWRVAGEAGENVSADIPINHADSDGLVLARVVADMKELPLESDPGGSPSMSGWVPGNANNPGIDAFRVDPHEFTAPASFALRGVSLAAFERTNEMYEVSWEILDEGACDGELSLFFDLDDQGFDGSAIAVDLPLESGSVPWDTSALAHGQEVFLYGVITCSGLPANQTYARWPVVKDANWSGQPARLRLNRPRLRFGATQNGAVATSSQWVAVEVEGAGTPWWGAESNRDWIEVQPAAHLGAGQLTVAIQERDTFPAPALLDGLVTLTSASIDNSPQYLEVVLEVFATGNTTPAFGVVETPADGATGVAGNIPVTGWALDDIEVVRVDIWRDPMDGEPVHPNGKVYIGEAAFVPGARPDVAAAFPDHPMHDRAGWGYMLLTNFLPSGGVAGTVGGNGAFVLHAYAHDAEGNATLLGSRTIHCDNANATEPFGTIDTPGQGATVSGTVVNFGWALTPQPGVIPEDGSTIWVYIDGVPVGQPVYNNYRQDIADLFPGYANSDGAVGFYILDTTALSNGLHNIAWSVTDNLGRVQGIGSRFFWVVNQ